MNSILKELGRAIGRKLDRFNSFVETPRFLWALVAAGVLAGALVIFLRKSPEEQLKEAGWIPVQVKSTPSGAQIYLFEEDTGQSTPANFTLDPFKSYRFRIVLDGHEPAEIYWGAGGETTAEIQVDLPGLVEPKEPDPSDLQPTEGTPPPADESAAGTEP